MDYAPPARAVFLTGFMGTGKTTNGRRLARQTRLDFVDTDDVVEAMAGKPIPDIFAQDGEAAFREIETRALRRCVEGPRRIVATGGGIMTRDENIAIMREAGPIICLDASPETILSRVCVRGDRPLLNCEDPLTRIRELKAQRREAYAKADYTVRADYEERAVVLKGIASALGKDPRTALLISPCARVGVQAANGAYQVHIQRDALSSLERLCPSPAPGTRCAVITNEMLGSIYGERVLGGLAQAGWSPTLIALQDGESAKSLGTVAELYDRLVDAGVDAGGMVFALGGGVIGDVAGFAAATYRRGIPFAQLPTTLLAQVDASSGGKVAVNHPRAKNLIGAFHQPRGVIIDTATLETLPERELRSGLAEVIKHAAIADAALFGYLERDLRAFLDLEDVAVRYVLARNCQIKARFVEQDPFDRGVRACLNYGHTVGHAVERAAEQWHMRHGEAVAIGIAAEARLARDLGLCSAETAERQIALLHTAGLPTSAKGFDIDEAAQALSNDKKIAAGALRLPLVPEIGRVQIASDIGLEALIDALRSVAAG